MADVAGVQQKLRLHVKRLYAVECGLKSPGDVRIGGLVESHVAVADLNEAEFALRLHSRGVRQGIGLEHSSLNYAQSARSCPRHTFQKAAAVDAVVVVVMGDFVILAAIQIAGL